MKNLKTKEIFAIMIWGLEKLRYDSGQTRFKGSFNLLLLGVKARTPTYPFSLNSTLL